MDTSLEELRGQRAKIQEHLNWLDAQIRAREVIESSEKVLAAPVEVPPVSEEVFAPPEKASAVSEGASPAPISPEPSMVSPLSSNLHGEILKLRLGCTILFVGATLLFLFLLFGLPYLR